MHALFFATKRAFHGILRITRRPLGCYGLTPARFDLLYALSRGEGLAMRQSILRRILGVAASTVSRMLKSLEALGFVSREREPYGDSRQRLVRLTALGDDIVESAESDLVSSGAAELALACALGCSRWFDEEGTVFVAMCSLESHLRSMRQAFGDHATLHYPWHPDD
jgi:DNA-binding MarR family transcriptional regulator